MKLNQIVRLSLALLLALFVVTSNVSIAAASGVETINCMSSIGKKIPILLIHGFNGDTTVWKKGPHSMQAVIDKIPNTQSDAFDYAADNDHWVTNDNVGPKLARQISCIAANSRKQGGYGKVVLVAHSMGGLAVRFAVNQVIDGRKVSDDTGLVVTLGTPYLGSELANWVADVTRPMCSFAAIPVSDLARPDATYQECIDRVSSLGALSGLRIDSPQLVALPAFPSSIPVRSIAGNVQQTYWSFFGTKLLSQNSDLIVSTTSATQDAAHPEQGGGSFTINCTGTSTFPFFTDAACAHIHMVEDPQFQQRVMEGIKLYIASLQPKPSATFCGNANVIDGVYPVEARGVDCVTAMQFAQAFSSDGMLSPEDQALRAKYPCKYKPDVTHRAVCTSAIGSSIVIG